MKSVVLFCEGTDGGSDVRLLETARRALEPEIELARAVEIRPAGSKGDLPATVRQHRATQGKGNTRSAVAIRDRDFLRADVFAENRRKALEFDTPVDPPRAWPLARHSIESYLLDPDLLGFIVPTASRDLLDELAAVRLWLDAVRATHEHFAWKVRRERAQAPVSVSSQVEAEAVLETTLGDYSQAIENAVDLAEARVALLEFAADFRREESLWTRVAGDELLKAVETRLRDTASLPGGDLKGRLLVRAEEHEPPAALVTEFRHFLVQLGGHLSP